MRTLNVINTTLNRDWEITVHMICSGFHFEQVQEACASIGLYLPRDQYELLDKLINTSMDLDIGCRKSEVPHD
jgi:hypothetical protein